MSLLKQTTLALAAGTLAAGLLAFVAPGFQADAATEQANPAQLQPVSAFAGIKNGEERSLALFQEVGKVIQSPRCMNCHPATDRPTQTDKMRPHIPLVVRGEGGVGEPGVPPLGPAVANAMAKLGLGRPRQLPIVPGASA